MSQTPDATTAHGLVRRLGLFDATMLVMGGIVGAGIFVNPAEVARHVAGPALIVGMWVAGGAIALAGAFYAELAARRPGPGDNSLSAGWNQLSPSIKTSTADAEFDRADDRYVLAESGANALRRWLFRL